ncbi:YheC/YheD family endospore coat-associated protein [Bacillus sp. USDA818B3_A]|uniref:YheC/YheD family endospore coat-associated protein n=1 Tax=Bacillus sp. USDA818B3_A TaxID=2698834 RepID=UPI001368F266|nr:YheC/YheD family protein [Bacillus sp. USDA818B3_A]
MSTKVKPLVGIVTSRKSDGTIAGNGPLFIAIQKKLISLNGISFVFIPEDVEDEVIYGYVYSPEHNCWKKDCFPFPDLVYNRIPFRSSEKDEISQRFFSLLKEKKIPFFNPCFINKYELYQLFKNDTILKNYIPETILVSEPEDLFGFLMKFRSIYLKPAQSSKGKGIFRLRLAGPSKLKLEGIKRQEYYQSFEQFWMEWNRDLLRKSYLAQEEIDSSEYDGSRFDFRILAHSHHEEYLLTGVGIRLSEQQDVTTHIPSGGKILPYELFQSKEQDELFQTIVSNAGKVLSSHYGFFGEFTIDAGLSKNGRYYIYEVNSKPMSFDEAAIDEKKIEHLCRLFLNLSQNA